MSTAPRHCEPCQSCQCTPHLLATWRGQPFWSDNQLSNQPNAAAFLGDVDARRIAGTQYQWRISWNYEDAEANADFVLASAVSLWKDRGTVTGGPVRDGLLINLPGTPGNSTDGYLIGADHPQWDLDGVGGPLDLPWRLELGCVRCRCRGARQIYWPIRHDWSTTPVLGEPDPVTGIRPIVDVTQQRYRDADDYGRALTLDESARDHWHGGGPTGAPYIVAASRRCPPTEIRWLHRFTRASADSGASSAVVGLVEDDAGYTQWATGWHSDFAGGIVGAPAAIYREPFDVVSLDQVNRITLLQPPTDTVNDNQTPTLVGVEDDPDDITDAEIDALLSWLDDGPPRLLTISGCGGFRLRMNAFLGRFCSLGIQLAAYANYPGVKDWMFGGAGADPLIPGSALIDTDSGLAANQNPRYVARNHPLVEYPATIGLPAAGFSITEKGAMAYVGTTGGEVLYDLEYDFAGGTFDTRSFPAVTIEQRANGSRIVLAPQWGFRYANLALAGVWSPFDLVNYASHGLLSHSAALLADYPPTVPANASVTG